MSAATNPGGEALQRLTPENCVFLICDVQAKFAPVIHKFGAVVAGAERMRAAAKELGVPCIITEQYPKGLGHTTEEIKVAEGGEVFSKTLFSMLTDEVRARLDTLLSAGRRNFVIVGLEAHVCVQQTSLDLLAMGCGVQLCVDAVSSQTTTDRAAGLHRAERAGALLTSSESVLFELIRAKEHPSFKAISKLVTSSRPPADVGTLGWLGA